MNRTYTFFILCLAALTLPATGFTQLQWATYYGGTQGDQAFTTALDPAGNIYIAGTTRSIDIATTSSFKDTLTAGGANDGFVVKFNPAGQRVWATYFGNTANEQINSIVCDQYGNVYIAGVTGTGTPSIATAGSYQTAFGGGNDLFLSKFNSSGQQLWCTYYGGTGAESGGYVSCDAFNNVYLAGGTNSIGGIASAGSHQSLLASGGINGFLVRFDSSGAVRKWGTYYCGTNTFFSCITTDNKGHVYAAGSTRSLTSSGIATAGAHDTTFGGGGAVNDGFMVKFDTSGVRKWGTYLGGAQIDDIRTIKLDKSGNLLAAGQTYSTAGIATTGSFKETYGGGSDGFVSKFNADSGTIKWSTYYGGLQLDNITGLSFSQSQVIVTGTTNSTAGVATPSGYQESYGGGGDGFLAAFDTNGYRIAATYHGGTAFDQGTSIITNDSGDIYIGGFTLSNSGIATSGSFKDTLTGTIFNDAFLAKHTAEYFSVKYPFSDTVVHCPGDTINIPYVTFRMLGHANVFTAELSDSTGDFTTATVIGELITPYPGTIACRLPYNALAGTRYRIRIKSSSPAATHVILSDSISIKQGPLKPIVTGNDTAICVTGNVHVQVGGNTPGTAYSWNRPFSGYPYPSINFSGAKLQDSGDYIVTASYNGCIAHDTLNVVILPKSLVLHITSNSPLCDGDTMRLSANDTNFAGLTYKWSGPAGFNDTLKKPVRYNAKPSASGIYKLTVNFDGCGSDSADITINPNPVTSASSAPEQVFTGDELMLMTTDAGTGATYSWTGPDTFFAQVQNPVIPDVTKKAEGTYIVVATLNGCKISDSVLVVINEVEKSTFELVPNPNKGIFTVSGNVADDQSIPYAIVNSFGHVILKGEIVTVNKLYSETITLPGTSTGTYFFRLQADGKKKMARFVIYNR